MSIHTFPWGSFTDQATITVIKIRKYDDHVGLNVLKCPWGSFTDEAAITVTKIRKYDDHVWLNVPKCPIDERKYVRSMSIHTLPCGSFANNMSKIRKYGRSMSILYS